MYPRELQAEKCVIVGSFLYSHRDMQGKRLMEFLYHLIGYHMTSRWKSINTRPEEGKEVLRLWYVETDEKDKSKSPYFWNPCATQIREIYFSGIQTMFPLRCEILYWDTWNG
jgi:hypothetical protein